MTRDPGPRVAECIDESVAGVRVVDDESKCVAPDSVLAKDDLHEIVRRVHVDAHRAVTIHVDMENCVMLYATGGWVGVQDSKEYASTPRNDRTTLAFTGGEFATFLKGAKAGEFHLE